MSQSIIRYRTKPDQADANAELVRAVYAELHRTRPDGFRYTHAQAGRPGDVRPHHPVRTRPEPDPRDQGVRRVPGGSSGIAATSPRWRRPSPRWGPTAF